MVIMSRSRYAYYWFAYVIVLLFQTRLINSAQPWRCLCRGSEQITMTRPWRRITLHLLQIFLTLGLTFTANFSSWPA
jgi:hypothetical protein